MKDLKELEMYILDRMQELESQINLVDLTSISGAMQAHVAANRREELKSLLKLIRG